MILWTKKLKFATVVVLSAVALPSFAQSQASGQDAYAAQPVSDFGSPYAEATEVGQPGAYFEQAATSECQSSGCVDDRQSTGFLSKARSLRPFGDTSGLSSYRSVFGAWNDLEDFDDGGVGNFNDGFVLGTAKGIYLNPNWRIERESSWRNNSGDDFTSNGVTTQFDGRLNNFSKMINVIREFGPDNRITPYAGLGAGATRQDGEFIINGENLEIDDWAFAYQGIVGLQFKTSPNVSFFAEYRYIGNSDTELENATTGVDVGDFEYQADNVVFGIQFKR